MNKKYYSVSTLKQLCRAIFEAAGVPPNEAEVVSDSLLWANLRGIDSHGVSRVPVYVARIKNGLVSPKASYKVVNENKVITVLDGGNSLGQIIALEAVAMGINKAKDSGVGICAVRNTNHVGMLAYYTSRIAEQGYIGIAFSNAPPAMAPWGGRKPMLGTNPISFAVPAGKYGAVILDMATSTVARGKIREAAAEGKAIPPDWALDREGRVTTDPGEALKGALFPLGGAKGYGLALMADIFSGVLTGAAYCDLITPMYLDNFRGEEKRNIGNFICVLNINTFLPLKEFIMRMEDQCFRLKDSPKAEGITEIYLPGEIEEIRMRERLTTGIPLGEKTVAKLLELACQAGVKNTLCEEVQ